ncbi:unnamed protein product [Trifolium pratense]|uniref:Uncharacterized protein n=3 Tax=Trifolium pratense TaxID=57577 RepID=A0ACB0L5T3_TRIPR|nr:unnamed protein product [Trifolium pratense]CAJ2664749.1 unnamed protein product [Trifolium pratense]CAJ2664753.1 unnamed protein product [Trifolium pratense]
MAASIKCVYFLIAILCIVSVLTPGEAYYYTYCAEKGPCPNNDKVCSYICINKYEFPRGGFCSKSKGLCCCRGGY